MSKRQEQTQIPGTEPEDITTREDDARLYAWLDAKTVQRKAAGDTKLAHSVLIAALAERGIDRYPYVDQFTGKKRFLVVKREPRATTTKVPAPPRARRSRKHPEIEAKLPDEDRVEHRKVSRESVEAEIDPFAATRRSMEH